jgi:hypothetical protein
MTRSEDMSTSQAVKPPVWLLDIDGVINHFSAGKAREQWQETRSRNAHVEAADGVSYAIRAMEAMLRGIRTMHRAGLVEIRWHTTWQKDAHKVADAMGLPRFPIADAPEYGWPRYRNTGTWKYPAALRVVAEEKRRLIWTDDDMVWFTERELSRLHCDGRALLIPVNGQTGLTPQNLTDIEAYARLCISEKDGGNENG